jgi:hypothetical protein
MLSVFIPQIGSISLLASDSDKFSKVVEKFRKAWAREKIPNPAINFVFKVTNNALKQKWTASRGSYTQREGR